METLYFQRKRLEQKLAELTQTLRSTSRDASIAHELGDAVDSAEFESAVKDEHLQNSRINDLRAYLRDYVLSREQINTSRVSIGTSVKLQRVDTLGIENYHIVGNGISYPENNEISYLSPLGRALIGAELGDIRYFKFDKKQTCFKVTSIQMYDPPQ